MASFLHELTTDDLTQLNETHKQAALNALEHEQIIFLPNYFFKHDAQASILFNENLLDKRHKNLSFNHKNQQLKGQAAPEIHVQTALKTFLDAFACFSHDLISRL
ncbi:MAG TPA: hypothetical protein DEO98_06730, partial [Legionellales bacterium]|nr:hypothetical protein [Legionellales bacterium]